MLVVGFPAGPWGTNCYVVAAAARASSASSSTRARTLIDGIDEAVREHGLQPVAVLLTHGHIDHVWSVVPVCGARGIPAYLHPDDRALLADPMSGISARDTRGARGDDRWRVQRGRARRPAPARRRRRARARRPPARRRPRAGSHARIGDVPPRGRGRRPADAALRRRPVRGLDRAHRPAGRRPLRDAAQPAREGPAARRRDRGAARSRWHDHDRARARRPTPILAALLDSAVSPSSPSRGL